MCLPNKQIHKYNIISEKKLARVNLHTKNPPAYNLLYICRLGVCCMYPRCT